MYSIPFGKTELTFDLPLGMKALIAASRPVPPIRDLTEAIDRTLSDPVESPPLRELVHPSDRVCIVFTDMTRASPDRILVPALLRELEAARVPEDHITLLCGVGLHRPTSAAEKIAKLSSAVVNRYQVVDHRAWDPEAVVDLGPTQSGIPLTVNRLAFEADVLIATGIVEPHQFAGYSGGRKTVAIGAAGEATIAHTHGPEMMDHPRARLGTIDRNPFHEAVTESARRAGLQFILNVVLNDQKRPAAVLAGHPEPVFDSLVAQARQIYEVPVPEQVDVAVAGVGFPKDVNIYQACRAASYLFFALVPVVRDGGVIIVPAPTPEGAGEGIGERRFFEKLSKAPDMGALLQEMRTSGYPPGAQRAFIMAKVLEKVNVIVVGSQTPDLVRRVHMIPAPSMVEAFRMAAQSIGRRDLSVLVAPHALLTLPIVS